MDPRRYRAFTARAACEAGAFKLMGRPLRALCAHHYLLLEALESPVLSGAPESTLTLLDLEIVAQICEHRTPSGGIEYPSEIALFTSALIGLPPADSRDLLRNFGADAIDTAFHDRAHDALQAQRDILLGWLNLCLFPRPASRGEPCGAGFSTADSNVPDLLYRVGVIMSVLGGDRDQWWYDTPVAELLWWFETAREQRDGV